MNALLSLMILLAPLRMETGRFTIYQEGKKIGTEEFTITPKKGGYVVEGHTVISDANQKADLKSVMELNDSLKPLSYEFDSAIGSIKLKVDAPISQLEFTIQGEKHTEDVRFPNDGIIIDTNFFHHYAILLYRIGANAGSTTIPAFAPQELQLGPLTVRNLGNSTYEMDTGSLKVNATTDKDGRLIRLAVPDAKVVVER